MFAYLFCMFAFLIETGSRHREQWHIIASGPCAVGSQCPTAKNEFQWTGVNGTDADHQHISQTVAMARDYTRSMEHLFFVFNKKKMNCLYILFNFVFLKK